MGVGWGGRKWGVGREEEGGEGGDKEGVWERNEMG